METAGAGGGRSPHGCMETRFRAAGSLSSATSSYYPACAPFGWKTAVSLTTAPAVRRGRTPRSARRPLPLPVRPHGQLVAARVGEVEPAAARKGKRGLYDLPARLLDLRFDVFQSGGVDHDERATGSHRRRFREPAAQASVLEARVVRPVVFEPPVEDVLIELLDQAEVGRTKLDIIDLPVMIGLHRPASFVGSRVREKDAPSVTTGGAEVVATRVARGRIELPTRGFSVRCSTN